MSFFEELKRRNVVRVGVAYIVIAWTLAQLAEFAVDNFAAPAWTLQIFVIFMLLGLPLVLLFAWAYELTPEGIKREKDVDRSGPIANTTGKNLDRVIIGVLIIAIGVLLADKFFVSGPAEDEVIAVASEPLPDEKPGEKSQSIAVLPFVNMSDDKDYFADGLSEELLNLLARIPDLKVAGRTSSFAFKGRNEDLRVIGEALNVEHVLEGSVRRSGDKLRVTAQLIHVADGFHLWSQTYDRQMADIFSIQDDVAGSIVSELKLRLAPAAQQWTTNPEAYALYLQALAMADFPDGDITEAIELLDQATQLDPRFAKAYELKALAYWAAAGFTMDAQTAQRLVYRAAMKALELDPTLVGARSFSITASLDNWNWVDELAALETAVAAAPNDIRTLDSLVYDLNILGYSRESLSLAQRLVELDPLSGLGYGRKSQALRALGLRDQANSTTRKLAELGMSEFADTDFIFDHLVHREFEQAIVAIESSPENFVLRDADARSFVEAASHPGTGRDYLLEHVRTLKADAANLFEFSNAQLLLLAFGYLDDFWREIEDTAAQASLGWTNADALEAFCMSSPANGCRSHPKYLEHAKRTGLTDLWDQRGAPDHCTKIEGRWQCR